MAEKKKPATPTEVVEASQQSTAKRRLRNQPTLREQAERAQTAKSKAPSKKKSTLTKPFRALGRGLKKIWASKVFTPLRWLGRILVPKYFRNAWAELRLVSWPKPSLVWRLTGAVLIFGLIMGLFIAGLDFVFEKLFREVLIG